jgi:glycosyltransferase involved in cell wall biosynthesis
MNLLILSDNYYPEMNANARIFSELAELWAEKGQAVSVITCHPNFPKGKIFPGYKNKWLSTSILNHVKVIRVKTYMRPNHGLIRRTLDFISFGLSAFFFGLWQSKPDKIIGVTPQFFCALSACCLSIIKKVPFIMIVCDLWPDAVAASGFIKKNGIYKFIKKIELWMYHKANSIIILSDYYRYYLNKLGIPDRKIITSISGASKEFYPRKKNPSLLANYHLSGKFVVGYIGTFGISHNHEDIIAIAESLTKKNYNQIHFLMIGDGPKRNELVQYLILNNINNVTIDGPFPGKVIPEYWSLINLAIIPLALIETNKMVLPSKIIEAMAMGIPVLFYGPDGEARRFLSKSGMGWSVMGGDKASLEKLILSLADDELQMSDQAHKSLNFAKNFSREKQAEELLTHLKLLNK